MTTPITGAISLGDVRTELGASGAISIGSTNPRDLAGIDAGTISLSDLRACTAFFGDNVNVNLFTAAGSPATVTTYKFAIMPSARALGSGGVYALTVGQFATGSTIILNNYNQILGQGGAAGSAGGNCINANYANQTVVINNKSGALIYGGGGGGGAGGTGGAGGGGYYTYSYGCFQSGPGQWNYCFGCGCDHSCLITYGNGYCASGCAAYVGYGYYCYTCYYTGTCYATAYTDGGAGGAGGSGGVGQGWNQSATAGSAGSGGAAGGTNAGYGGTGGTGGAGASYGSAGSSGSTGGTGSNGNNGSGAGGAAGAAGGAAGYYLVKGSNAVTLNNSGTVLGNLG